MSNEIKNIMDNVNKFKRAKTLSNNDKAEITLIPATKALGLAKKLLNIIAPAVGGTLDGLRHDDYIHGAPRSFTDMALTLTQKIDESQLEEIIIALMYGLKINGENVNFDEYFTGNYGTMVELAEFSLKENFETFFTGKGIKARFLKTIQIMLSGMETFQEE